MTDLIAPASTPTPASPSARTRSGTATMDRPTTFGPALADARDQLQEGSDPDRPTASDPSRSTDSHTAAEPVVSRDGTESEGSDGDNAGPDNERVDEGEGDTPNPIHDESAEAAHGDIEGTGATANVATPAAANGSPSIRSQALAPTHSSGERNDHPTAKGAVGDGDLSTIPTVDEVAAPRTLSAAPPGEATASDAGAPATGVARPTVGPIGTVDAVDGATAAYPAELAMAAETTSVDGGAKTNSAAVGLSPEAATTLGSADTTAARAHTGSPSLSPGPAVQPETANPSGLASQGISSTPAASETSAATVPVPPADPAAVDAADVAFQSTESGDGDSVVVLAREAARPESLARPTAAPSTAGAPTAGPLDATTGNLWEDVRIAFDRVRTSGEGQEVRMRLRPAELGELVVQIRTQGDHVAVKLITSSAAAQQTLVDDRLRLAAELARAGFDEGSVDIGQQGRDRDRGDERNEGQLGRSHQQADHDRGRGRTITEPAISVGERPDFERRAPIRTESGIRPGRHVNSTINLTL